MHEEGCVVPADQEDLVLAEERHRVIEDCVQQLAERHQVLLWLRYTEECTFLEIAVQFQVSEPAVHQMHARILRRLRAMLRERRIEEIRDLA